jgi:tRNA(Ile)-lysidine synthase
MDRLSFPLELRPWRMGDRSRPVGLGGSKLVSDVLTDAKVPLTEKEGTYVLVSGGTIVWIVGHRITQGFQATPATKQVFRMCWPH